MNKNITPMHTNLREILHYDYLYVISGFHSYSLTALLGGMLFGRLMFKSRDGTVVEIPCLDKLDANYAKKLVDEYLKSFGYFASVDGSKLRVELPWHSTSRMLAAKGGVPLFCVVIDGVEHVYFSLKKGHSTDSIKKYYEQSSQQFESEFQKKWIYPDKIDLVAKDIWLPEFVGVMTPEYVDFLISQHARKEQVKTFDALFHLVHEGCKIDSMPAKSLENKIAELANMKEKTVRNHIDKTHQFQHKLMEKLEPIPGPNRKKILIDYTHYENLIQRLTDLEFESENDALAYCMRQALQYYTNPALSFAKQISQTKKNKNLDLQNNSFPKMKMCLISNRLYGRISNWIQKNLDLGIFTVSEFAEHAIDLNTNSYDTTKGLSSVMNLHSKREYDVHVTHHKFNNSNNKSEKIQDDLPKFHKETFVDNISAKEKKQVSKNATK